MFMWMYLKLPTSHVGFSPPKKTEKYRETVLPPIVDKTVDFVLVYEKINITDEAYRKISSFVDNLEDKGFELESAPFSVDDEINFIKIHAPKSVLRHYAKIYGIELAYQNTEFRIKNPEPLFGFAATELTKPSRHSKVLQRTGKNFLPAVDITSAEKGLIIYRVLSKNSFGPTYQDYGLQKLLNQNVLSTAYPVHDGPQEWSEEGELNDRQLLAKYWSSLRCWYKQQPLDLIEKYYGAEIAFYFAWLGFYCKMLIPVSILGLVCFILGLIIFKPYFDQESEQFCNSDKYLCPKCVVENCQYELLRNACFYSHFVHLLDNPIALLFSALMSIWATVFLELWEREEALLQIRWNLKSVEVDLSMRSQFEESTKYRKVSKITGQLEPYIPKHILCYRYAITTVTLLFWVMLMVLGLIGVLVYITVITTVLTQSHTVEVVHKNVVPIASMTGSALSVFFILIFELLYEKIALFLTRMECPRTQLEFNNSYTFKTYLIAFVNNYTVIFYIAFVKGKIYTFPGDQALWNQFGGIGGNLCNPAGCIFDLGIQLVFVLTIKNIAMTALQFFVPKLWMLFKKMKTKIKNERTPQWESDYMLNQYLEYQLNNEYMQMIIQYGFVIFFVVAFPLAPLLALINNLVELRVDATKLTNAYRRPVSFKVANIGAWNDILRAVTYLGVVTNACVIAFTSAVVERAIFVHKNNGLRGFVASTFSAFNVSEFPVSFNSSLNVTLCYYPGKRNPPDHPERYELSEGYWYELTMKFLAVVVFEHTVMTVTGMIAYAIPKVPFSVKEHINFQKDHLKEMKMKNLYDYQMSEAQRAQQKENILHQINQ